MMIPKKETSNPEMKSGVKKASQVCSKLIKALSWEKNAFAILPLKLE